MHPATATEAARELPRSIGFRESVSIIVGTIIGAGIFLLPSSIAQELQSPGLVLAVWLVTGLISFCGALAYAELGAMLPRSGGLYAYIRECYGPLAGFVCGWTLFLVIVPGSIAGLMVGCGIYLSYLLPSLPMVTKWAPAALIALLTLVNYRGVKPGTAVQQTLTVLKLAGLAILIGSAWFGHAAPLAARPPMPALPGSGVIGLAMLACFLAYDGWHYISFIAGEVRDPARNLPRALALGVGVVIGVYLLANIAYLRILPFPELAATPHVAAAAAERALGPVGATIVAVTIVLSTIGAANGLILTSPRITYAQARDGLLFRRLGDVHPRYETPGLAILVQGIWALILSLKGSYVELFSYVMFAAWIFHAMAVSGLIILRRRQPDRPRPYKMWGYPVAPILFVAFSCWLVANTVIERPGPSWLGLLIIASGVPAYFVWRRAVPRRSGVI